MSAVSELFDPGAWVAVDGFDDLADITYHHDTTGRIARVAFDRPEVRNAFRPRTVDELARTLDDARMNPRIGVVLLTGNGPSPKDGGWAFCSGGDQRIRGRDGYKYSDDETVDPHIGLKRRCQFDHRIGNAHADIVRNIAAFHQARKFKLDVFS